MASPWRSEVKTESTLRLRHAAAGNATSSADETQLLGALSLAIQA